MNRSLKIAYLVVFFVALAVPMLHFFGVKESWHKIYGSERIPKVPDLTFDGFVDGSYQQTLTEHFAKSFLLRHTFYTTSRQINEAANLGLFHAVGYAGGTIEGKAFDERGVGVIFEDPYARYHLLCHRPFDASKFAKSVALLKDFDEFCRTNGMDFVFQSVPDKLQAYPDYVPDWMTWVWNYTNFPVQTYLAKLCNESGVKALDGVTLFDTWRKEMNSKYWLYPPGGTHMTCLASARLQSEVVRRVNEAGRIHLEDNPIVRVVEKPDAIWSVDNDISMLLNTWSNPHVDTNCHYFPEFAKKTPKPLNEGSAFIIGDCYRDQMSQIFAESGLFAKKKIRTSIRKGQKPEHFKDIIKDLKLVVLTFQSFNSGLMREGESWVGREVVTHEDIYNELNEIFTALRTAKLQALRK